MASSRVERSEVQASRGKQWSYLEARAYVLGYTQALDAVLFCMDCGATRVELGKWYTTLYRVSCRTSPGGMMALRHFPDARHLMPESMAEKIWKQESEYDGSCD